MSSAGAAARPAGAEPADGQRPLERGLLLGQERLYRALVVVGDAKGGLSLSLGGQHVGQGRPHAAAAAVLSSA